MLRNVIRIGLMLVLGMALHPTSAPVWAADGWVELFDGETLNGWTQLNGTANYRVLDGMIVGATSEGSPNSFLCTDKPYGDFELTFDVKVDNPLNSGVQIRSQTYDPNQGEKRDIPVGRVNGPQVEIEAASANGSLSGYVYGEATGRGWLTKEDRLAAHPHFKNGDWNTFRVVAKGPRIQTFINGQAIEDLTDASIYETHATGFIGLQVHGIRQGSGPYHVAWRNIRLRPL